MKAGHINLDTMHEDIKNGLKTWTEEKSFSPGEVAVWIPQFKMGGNKEYTSMDNEPHIRNYKVGE